MMINKTGTTYELNLLNDIFSLQMESSIFDRPTCLWHLNITVFFPLPHFNLLLMINWGGGQRVTPLFPVTIINTSGEAHPLALHFNTIAIKLFFFMEHYRQLVKHLVSLRQTTEDLSLLWRRQPFLGADFVNSAVPMVGDWASRK